MAIQKIEILGSPVLRERAAEVVTVDAGTRTLIQNLFDTMYNARGIGLAAPQIAVSQRAIVLDVRPSDPQAPPPLALLNPRIVEASQETTREVEGCLSIPGLEEVVERAAHVVVEAVDPDQRPVRLAAAGMFARALQHEIDHLDGILFLDRISPLKRRLLLQKWKKVQAEAPEP